MTAFAMADVEAPDMAEAATTEAATEAAQVGSATVAVGFGKKSIPAAQLREGVLVGSLWADIALGLVVQLTGRDWVF